jgi:hypothetical protein
MRCLGARRRAGTALRWLAGCAVCCAAAALVLAPGVALGEGPSSGEGSGAPSPLGDALVTSGSPVQGEQMQAAEEAQLANPEAARIREESRTKFEGLDGEAAAQVAGEAFPQLVDESAGGPPKLPAGQSITGYVSDNAAQIDLPEGGHAVVESIEPLAIETSPGHREPLDLSLSETGGAFQPTRPEVAVHIPKQLVGGVQLQATGVSLTPVGANGAALGGSEGVLDGATVFYGDTGTDADTLVKPTTLGFEEDTLLRSVGSPDVLYFKVGLPAGASLVQARDGSGTMVVVKEGVTIATILPPDAQDAAGTAVPVSMSVSGDTLVLSVAGHAAEYQYPIEVDPEVKGEDSELLQNGKRPSNWEFYTSNGKKEHSANFASNASCGEHWNKLSLETCGVHEYKEGESAFWMYQTRGVSKIYEFEGETEGSNKEDRIESIVELQHEGGVTEEKELLSNETTGPVEYARKALPKPLCPKGEGSCVSTSGNKENAVHFQQSVVNKPSSKYSFSDAIDSGTVYISEPEIENAKKEKETIHSTTSYNTSTETFKVKVVKEGKEEEQTRTNALYGSGSWLSEYGGAIQLIAKDPGIGVAKSVLEYENAGKWEVVSGMEHNYLEEGLCKGMQCEAEQKEYWTLNPHLPNGNDKIRYRAEEAFGDATHETESLPTEGVATVKVDDSKPHSITIRGLPYGNELSERKYELTAYATDGEGSTVASSGVKSVEMFVDGKAIEDNEVKNKESKEAGKREGECGIPTGECTATAKYSIEGAELGAGHHSIQLVVYDNAGNEARLPGGGTEISIRHSTPVALGPGSVDLESGDFSLGTSDVSMGSGLMVSRAYSSRATGQGDEGPLGPEWTMGLASTESVTEMVDGSLLMTSANGSQAIFAESSAGVKCEAAAPFEAPPGDSNLKLWCEENKETKQRVAYYLEDAADHSKVKFTLPESDTNVWVPTTQEGAVATDTLAFAYQPGEKIAEYTSGTRYGASAYEGITKGPDGNLWAARWDPGVIEKITTSGQVTEYPVDEHNGRPQNIVTGPDGNLWYTNGNDIGRITTSGTITEWEFPKYREPVGITSAGGDLWVTETNTEHHGIAKVTPSGTITGYSTSQRPEAITTGPEGNIWFATETKIVDMSLTGTIVAEYTAPFQPNVVATGSEGDIWFASNYGKIGKITTSGTESTFPLPEKSYVYGLAAGPEGDMWFTNDSKIGRLTPSGKVSEYASGTTNFFDEITTGPDQNLWYTVETEDGFATGTIAPATVEPKEVLAPVPAKVSCTPMEAGCRALKFTYGTKTTATGESESEWGEYLGRLAQVRMDAYNPASKKMEETAVAEYRYDRLGRLRAEWDPRISPALKTTYGYDAEGHVTALNPPGQEPWSLTYGTSAGDSGTGRLLKATRAPTSAGVWGGGLVKNTEAPKITGSAVVGVRLAVSSGKWSGSPLTYGYQWEECNSENQCTPIQGADNANYTPVAGNVGHTLVAQVTATNGGGSELALTAATAAVAATSLTQTVDSGNAINAVSCVPSTTDCVLSDSKGNAFYATNVSATASATWSAWGGPTGKSPSQAVDCPTSTLCLLADGKSAAGGNVYYATSLGGTWTTATSPIQGIDAISCASSSFCIAGQGQESGDIRYSTTPGSTSWIAEDIAGSTNVNGAFCLSSSFCTAVDSAGNLHVATSTSQIESASWTNTDIDGTTALNGIACTSTTSCVAVDGAGNLLKLTIESSGKATVSTHDIDGTNSLTAITCTGTLTCVTVDNGGNVFGSKTLGESWTKMYTLSDKLTSVSCASKTLCATVDTAGNVTALNPTGRMGTEGELQGPGPGTTIDYQVPVKGSEAPYNMSEAAIAKWSQKAEEAPVEATAIFPPDSPQGWPAANYTRASIDYLDEQGRLVNTASPSTGKYGSISTTEYNEYNDVIRTLSPDNRATALEAGEANSAKVSKLLDTEYAYNEPECRKETDLKEEEAAEPGTRLCETWGPEHEVRYTPNGFKGQKESLARSHTLYFYEDSAHGAPETEHFDLVTETQTLAQLLNSEGKYEEEVESRKSTTSYSGQSGLGWTLRAPTSTTAATESEGAKLTTTTLYNKETGQITETRGPEGSGGESAHDRKIIYYSVEESKEGYAGCGKHPEWAGLVCETVPVKQPPETTGVPKLPETTTTYNMWDEPETIVETFPKTATFGEKTRTTKNEYDAVGRLKSSEETSTATTESTDKVLPKVTNVYNEKTGALEKQSTTGGEKTKTTTSVYNTLGQLETYTDADGNVAKFKYGGPEKDGLLEEMSDSSDETGSNQKYTYSETTKQLTKLLDSAAGTFTASYDTEGKLASVVYPNEICANYTYNAEGEATHLEYTKTTSCSEKEGVWFGETKVPSVRGETMSRTSTLAKEEYAYDTLGRLTEVTETPAGEYCKVRIYGYDEESNRTRLITREPNSKKECATEGGTVEEHAYDEANRLIDGGMAYDALGNTTKLPASDAEGHALESTFYVDNAVATQTQNGVTNDYYMDPDGRVRETVTGAKKVITHYDGSGEAVAWSCEGAEKTETCESGGKWTRNIPGIDGTLTAVENGKAAAGETPILQLHDLQGDIVATIKDKTGETKLESTYNSTEFGAPNGGKEPPKFAWLGAGGIEKSLASGVVTEGATSYVPQTGRALQSEGVAPPGLPDGSGGSSATFIASPWNMQGAERVGAEAPGKEAQREKEAFLAAMAATSDPSRHWKAWEAKKVGGELAKLLVIHDLVGQLGTVFGSHLAGDILKAMVIWELTGAKVEDWIEEFSEKLTYCASELHSNHDSHGGCWTKYEDFIWEGDPIPEFLDMPWAAWCEHMTSNTVSVSGCNEELYQEELEQREKYMA